MRHIVALALALSLAACAIPQRPGTLDPRIVDELNAAADAAPTPATEAELEQALIPPLQLELPAIEPQRPEPRFDISVNDAPVREVLLSIVSGTPYSMLVHPDVEGRISINLKDTTIPATLEALRALYGYEYRIEGNHIYVQSPTLQTRVFRVNYLAGQRTGRSEVRVISGSVADGNRTTSRNTPAATALNGLGNYTDSQSTSHVTDSARILTSTHSDFWKDLSETLRIIVGTEPGRDVVVNAQAGVIVVRGMPADMRNVEDYLRAIKLSVERQVMIEAKIIEVTLSDSFQSGINWAAFGGGRFVGGVIGPGNTLGRSGELIGPNLRANPAGRELRNSGAAGSVFGLAFQTHNFAALIEFLEGQGSVQVLSSPRIATLNNQKAVLKVGTDEFFVTDVQSGTRTTGLVGGATTAFPTLTLQPFFSGVALDITPQIDEASNVILHIHPSVSTVVQDDREIVLGSTFGSTKDNPISLPLARSTVSETDSIVKVADGNIVAIGGLMKVDLNDNRSGVPGVQDVPVLGHLFGSRGRTMVKKELVILIKPTIIGGETNPTAIGAVRDRILQLGQPRAAMEADAEAQ